MEEPLPGVVRLEEHVIALVHAYPQSVHLHRLDRQTVGMSDSEFVTSHGEAEDGLGSRVDEAQPYFLPPPDGQVSGSSGGRPLMRYEG